MEGDGGASTAQLHNLHLAPGYAVDACPQCFADGFFGGETTGEAGGLATALAYFRLCEDTFQEALPVVLVDFADAIHLDDVDPPGNIYTLRRTHPRGETRYSPRAQKPDPERRARP